MSLNVSIVTPYARIWEGEAEYLSFRTPLGEMGFLPQRAPIVAQLAVDVIEIKSKGERLLFAVHGGYILNTREKTLIVADAAERPEDIDIHRAEERVKRAEEILKVERDARKRARANAKMQRHLLRIRVYKEHTQTEHK